MGQYLIRLSYIANLCESYVFLSKRLTITTKSKRFIKYEPQYKRTYYFYLYKIIYTVINSGKCFSQKILCISILFAVLVTQKVSLGISFTHVSCSKRDRMTFSCKWLKTFLKSYKQNFPNSKWKHQKKDAREVFAYIRNQKRQNIG